MGRGHYAGGSLELARLIDEAGESVFADLKRYYGVDLGDVLRPESGLTPRQVLVYINQLPAESNTMAHLQGGDQFRGWSPEVYMLANVFDAVRAHTHTYVSANSKKKPKPFEPIERPKKSDGNKKKKTGWFSAMARAAYKKK